MKKIIPFIPAIVFVFVFIIVCIIISQFVLFNCEVMNYNKRININVVKYNEGIARTYFYIASVVSLIASIVSYMCIKLHLLIKKEQREDVNRIDYLFTHDEIIAKVRQAQLQDYYEKYGVKTNAHAHT